jgi:hypothetical protein
MRISPGPDEENKKIVLEGDESRQARTGQNVRYVLLFGLLGVIICFAIIFMVFAGTT